MVKYPNAASGLKKVFLAKMIGIIGAVLAIMPFVGGYFSLVCSIAACIFNVMGILEASKDHDGYRTALSFTVAGLVISVINTFVDLAVLQSILGLAESVCEVAVLYYICRSTSYLLRNMSNFALAGKGDHVWDINKICLIIIAVCFVLAFVPILNILAALTSVVVLVVTVYAGIVYLVFLYQSGQYLSLNTNF